jgi:hypothetical protein
LRQPPTEYELESRWVTAQGIPGVDYRFGDPVRIKSGEYSGQIGKVTALISIEPEPVYVVVLPPDEKSTVLSQGQLEPSASTAQ